MMSVVGAEQDKIIFNTLITVKSVFVLTVSTDIAISFNMHMVL